MPKRRNRVGRAERSETAAAGPVFNGGFHPPCEWR